VLLSSRLIANRLFFLYLCMAISFTIFTNRLGLLAGLLLGLIATAQAQAPAWQAVATAAPLNANSGALVTASATDANGNIYVAGAFIGSINLGGATYTSGRTRGAFVAKWHPATQSFAWVQQMQSTDLQVVTALAISGSQVYLAGTFYGTADFGSTTLTSAGSGDGFVAKLTDAGSSASFAWAQRMGGAGYDNANGLAVSGSSVYVAGLVNSTASFGGSSYTSAGSTDGFITKLIDAGSSATFAWTQLMGGPGPDHATGLAVHHALRSGPVYGRGGLRPA
jgi:hypothetical protein